MEREKLSEYIQSQLSSMKQVKARGEDRRIRCCAMLNHRLDDKHTPVSRMELFNTMPVDAINTTARGIAGYMLSPSIRWFRYTTKGKNFESSDILYGANDWLELVERQQYAVFSNSRFYPTTLEAIADALIVGTSYEMITDDVDNMKIVYDCYSPFECYIQENSQRRVDTWYREYSLTAQEAYAKWGDECPDEIIQMVRKGDGAQECNFIHAIFPRDKAEVAETPIPEAKSKKYASVHYSHVGEKVFRVSGYDEFPLAIQRYRLVGNSPYGVSLASDNLELIMEANELERKYLKATAKLVDPPVIMPVSLKGRASLNAGSIMYANSGEGSPVPVQTMLDIKALQERITEVNAMVNRMLFADLFNVLMRQDRQRTAYEVQELKGEGLVLLSAVIGNMQEEKLNPLVLRTLYIMLRNRLVPAPPAELAKAWAEGRVQVELDGPLAQTMKQYHQTTGLSQGLQWISAWAQAFPESLLNIDPDEGMRQGATSYGFPQSAIREKADVDKIKQKQAEIQQAQAQQQQALQQSQMMKNMGVTANDLAQSQQDQMMNQQRGLGL